MNRFKSLGLVLLGLFVLVGCSSGYSESELNTLVQTAMTNRLDIFTDQKDVSFDFVYDAGDNISAEFQEVLVNGNFSGYFNNRPNQLPEIDTVLNLDFTAKNESETIGGSVAGEIIVKEDDVYFYIDKLPENLLGEVAPYLVLLKDKWWFFTLPADVLDATEAGVSEDIIQKNRDLISSITFFEELMFVADEDLQGDAVTHMKGKFSSEGIKTYINEISVFGGAPLPAEEQVEIDSLLKLLEEANVDLWITKEDPLVSKMELSFEANVAEMQAILNGGIESESDVETEKLPEVEGTVKVNIIFLGSDFGIEKSVNAPEDAEEFTPEKAFGIPAGLEPLA